MTKISEKQKNKLLEIKYLPVAELISYDKNSRTHSPDQVAQIIFSIKSFGFTNPILIDEKKIIIAGHGRIEAAKKMGLAEVPTITLSGLTDTERRAYVIADNKIALNAGWDDNLLRAEMEFLKGEDFDLSIMGFTDNEVLGILEFELDGSQGADKAKENDVPEIPKEAIVKTGDIWLLGHHRLLCGDATRKQDVENLLAGRKPNLMVTDPPYGVEYDAGWRADAKGRKKTEREKTSTLQNDDRADWREAYELFPGDIAYVWHASMLTDIVKRSIEEAGFKIRQNIIWNKNVHALSRAAYHWKHEPCWYAIREGADSRWLAGRDQMTVWDIPSVIFEKDKTAHPTQKALGIYERPIINHTKVGEALYEPFGGSGTQIIACEKLQRVSYTMEIDPKFCDVIINRWQNYTGKDAVNEKTGQKYSELQRF